MNPLIRRVIGESILDVLDYWRTIQPQIDAARERALAEATNDRLRDKISHGHGHYVGSCGHTIQNCRCMILPGDVHPRIEVDAVCKNCAK